MIDSRELRIGNIVCYNEIPIRVNGIRPPKPLKDSYWSDEWILELLHGGLIDCLLENVDPIPLTEEWLLKFGFECGEHDKENNCRWWTKYPLELHQEYWQKADGDFVIGDSFDYPTYKKSNRFKGGFKVSSVHQLQNLYFALCGEELEIK